MPMNADLFIRKHRALVWSNSHADKETYLRAALVAPRYHTILDACLAFGLSKVRQEWQALREEGSREALRAESSVTRMLRNIEQGFQDAAA